MPKYTWLIHTSNLTHRWANALMHVIRKHVQYQCQCSSLDWSLTNTVENFIRIFQHSHFIRFDDGPYHQHVNPIKAMLDPSFGPSDLHPNTAVLNVPAYSTVLLVWRSTTLMDHPMHLWVATILTIVHIMWFVLGTDQTLTHVLLFHYYLGTDWRWRFSTLLCQSNKRIVPSQSASWTTFMHLMMMCVHLRRPVCPKLQSSRIHSFSQQVVQSLQGYIHKSQACGTLIAI